ncbi:WD40 repeat domain-containing protein [Streptomyces sp. URMC 129]|uniref:WD40 repeat domain-containing protein n=1 Tax=Streptomyces sp. URMC 129 TaxID=3423407 RepID=UPI003F1CDD0F
MTTTDLFRLLDSRPSEAGWRDLCALLERLDDRRLAAVTPRVLRWPAGQRPMPDHWWAQWVAGDVRPYHALAGTRRLGRLDHVETGTVPVAAEDDFTEEIVDELLAELLHGTGYVASGDGRAGPGGADGTGGPDGPGAGRGAYFYNGASAVGAPPGLRWLALAAAAEWHHSGGDIVRWDTTRDAPLGWYLSGGEHRDEAYDLHVSPDGRTVVTAVEGRWHAWSARTGEPLWEVVPDRGRDLSLSRDDLVRFAFSGDGQRLAVGTGSSDVVAVLDATTGGTLLRVPDARDAFGPVALDWRGHVLAHAGPAGRVVLRDVATGAVLATAETGLTSVGALALAPDGSGLFAVGGAVGGSPEGAGLATAARPAARLFALRPRPGGLAVSAGELLRPTGFTEGLDADSPTAAVTTRAIWTAAGPFAFIGADFGSVLFDGRGQTLWADPASALAAFTPDGRALVVVQEDIDAWFLDGLARPDDAAPPPPARECPGQVLLTGLPASLAGGAAGEAPAGGELPCSHWSVTVAAIADDARALAFCAKLDRRSADRPQVLCRWPEAGAPPEVSLLPAVEGAAYVADLLFGPRGDVLARALLGEEPCLVLTDVATGRTRWRHPLPPAAPHGRDRLRLAFSADGSRLALAAHTVGRVVVVDAATGETIREITEPARHPEHWRRPRVDMAALDTAGERVAFGARDDLSRVTVRDVATGKTLLRAEPARLRQITGLAFAPDGTRLAVAGSTDDGHAALWTLPLAGDREVPPVAPRIAVRDLSMHDQPDGTLVWSAVSGGPRAYFPGSHGWGAVWDAATGAVLAHMPFGRADGGVALAPDGRALVTVTQYGARRWPL